jgi:hypothetical protein
MSSSERAPTACADPICEMVRIPAFAPDLPRPPMAREIWDPMDAMPASSLVAIPPATAPTRMSIAILAWSAALKMPEPFMLCMAFMASSRVPPSSWLTFFRVSRVSLNLDRNSSTVRTPCPPPIRPMFCAMRESSSNP